MTFLDKIKQGCLDGWAKYKILPSLTAAQAILESGWGKHAPHNALFGIKADSSWTGKSFDTKTQEEYQAGVVTDIDAGYATASGYAELLIQIIKENGLQFWDAEVLKSNKEEKMISSQCREVIEFFINLANAGMGVDKDSFAGWQCADVPCYAAKHWFGVDLWGNAIDLLDSAAAVGWEV
ncbi:TPA: glucosaminidase domain-containing protein, partial [Streptococcus pyogenes]|nr:glucosaminidase domain-containing protein [Streptococcus pyogenes]